MFKPLKTETIQAFLDEARYLDTKPPERHSMGHWVCNTVSCAVGDMGLRGVCGLRIEELEERGILIPFFGAYDNYWAVAAAFGITFNETLFLFSPHNRSFETPAKTAARLRKYLYYRLRKAEILADYEKARRTGDIGVNIKPNFQAVTLV